MVRNICLHIAIVLLSVHAYGQNPVIELEIEPRTVETGQPFTITIKTNLDGHIEMTLPDEFIQSGVRQSGMSSSVELVRGGQRTVRYSFQSFTGYFEEEGTYSIGPVKVTAKKKEFQSEAYSVRVIQPQNMISEDPGKNLNQMMFGIIQQSKKEIYEGEPIVLEGKVYSQVEVMQVEDFIPFTFNGPVDSRLMPNSGRVSTSFEVINGKNLQTFKLGKSVIFPEKVGDYVIQPFQTHLIYNDRKKIFPQHAKIISNESTITVKPLPSGTPKEFIDGVGEFDVTAQLSSTHVKQESVVELSVRIEGKGNLHNIRHPKLSLPSDLSIYGDPEVIDSIFFSNRGAEGSKTFTYFVQVNRATDVQLGPIKIAYFNPETESYEHAQARLPMLKVEPNGSTDSPEDELEDERVVSPEMQPYIADAELKTTPYFDFLKGWGSVVLFSPIMLGASLGFFVYAKNQKEETRRAEAFTTQYKDEAFNLLSTAQKEEDVQEAIDMIHNALLGYLAGHFETSKSEITRHFLKSKSEEELLSKTCNRIVHVLDEIDAIKYGEKVDAIGVRQLVSQTELIFNEISPCDLI